MAVKFFGQFLVENRLVTSEALLQAIALQERSNLKFGEMAQALGFLSEADIERVHEAQRGEDLRFGDLVLKLGLMSEEQIQQVLTRQKNSHIYIGEALIRVGAIARPALERSLAAFKEDQAPYAVDRISIPATAPLPYFWEMAADLTGKMLTRVAGLAHRPGSCAEVGQLVVHEVIAAIYFSGAVRARYLLGVSLPIRAAIARALLKEEDVSGEPEEVLDDTLMEFVNIICGNIVAKAAQMGRAVEISPPQILRTGGRILPVPPGQIGLSLPILTADGELLEMGAFIEVN